MQNSLMNGENFWRVNMKNIVIILPSLQHGGVQRSLLEALKVINTRKYDITIYVYSNCNTLVDLVPANIKVIIDTDKSHYRRKLKSILLHISLLLAKILKRKEYVKKYSEKIHAFVNRGKSKYPAKKYFSNGVDIVVSYAMGLCTEMAMEIEADKHYLFFHSSDPNFHRDLSDKYFGKFDNIVAVGKNVQLMLKDNFPEHTNKIALIKNYIDPENIKRLSRDYVVDTDIYEKNTVITSVIRVDKEKGADLIVSAAAKLKRQNISFVWYIVGDGGTRAEIEKQIIENSLDKNVILVGFQDNPYPYIKCCDIFVHPAYEESFGLSILEALILGKSVISTETMGAKEVLNNGEFGLLVSIDADSIANAVIKLINNPELKIKLQSSYKYDEIEKHTYKEKWEKMLNGDTL